MDAIVTTPSRASERVIDDDDRLLVADVTASPYRCICMLEMTAASGRRYSGTGWLVGPRLVLTAGHCVFFHDESRWASHIDVAVGRSRHGVLARAISSELLAPQQWLARGSDDHDYGGIILAQPLDVGYLSCGALEDSELLRRVVEVTGYPADRDHGERQFTHAREIIDLERTRLHYDIDTYAGQSGAPVWLVRGDTAVVVGIHTQSDGSLNSALRIDAGVLATIRAWKARAR